MTDINFIHVLPLSLLVARQGHDYSRRVQQRWHVRLTHLLLLVLFVFQLVFKVEQPRLHNLPAFTQFELVLEAAVVLRFLLAFWQCVDG